jgi:hypothetical protein
MKASISFESSETGGKITTNVDGEETEVFSFTLGDGSKITDQAEKFAESFAPLFNRFFGNSTASDSQA